MIRNHWCIISYTVHGTEISLSESGTEQGTKTRSRSNTTQDICQPLNVPIQEIQNFRLVARFYISNPTAPVTAI